MVSVAERISVELQNLVSRGDKAKLLIDEKNYSEFVAGYQNWYTRSLPVIQHLLPDRVDDFQRQYRAQKRKSIDVESYVLEDYLRGIGVMRGSSSVFDIHVTAAARFNVQVCILASAQARLSDTLANIRGFLQADLFNSELDAARHLKNNGHLRAAGAVAGVVLEGHLKELCQKHQVKVPKKKATLADYNQVLTAAHIYDGTDSLLIQRLATLRNLCDHKKTREPRPDEVEELIDGADKVRSTLK